MLYYKNGVPAQKSSRYAITRMEQVRGIEPPTSAWEADVLPLNYTCVIIKKSSYMMYEDFGCG